MDYLMLGMVAALVWWLTGMANRGWPTPLDHVRKWRGHRGTSGDMSTDIRRSDAMSTPDVPGPGHVRTSAGEGPDHLYGGAVTVSREHASTWGPRPLPAAAPPAEPTGEDATAADRQAWLRGQVDAGRAWPAVTRDAVTRYGVTDKTIRRDRAVIEDAE